MRALLFLLLIIGLFFLVRAVINRTDQLQQEAKLKAEQEKQAETFSEQAEPMVTCEVCQVHLPEAESLCITDIKGEKYCFCSKDHLEVFIEKGGEID